MKALVRLMSVPEDKRDLAWLQDSLEAAIQLELCTIPLYLYAYWSIDPTSDDPNGIASSLRQIAVEEMQHMAIACNLLASTGGHPDILKAAPIYPATFPKDVHKGLEVNLVPFTPSAILGTFMRIEEPQSNLVDDPDFTPSGSTLIGDFYDAVKRVFETEAPTPLVLEGQVDLSNLGFKPDQSFVIAISDDMKSAIDVIKKQGEGSDASPFEQEGELAHFYQFGEMFHARTLEAIPGNPSRFAYSGKPLIVPAVRSLAVAGEESAEFNHSYSSMLRSLQDAWDTGSPSTPGRLDQAVGAMFGLSGLAENLAKRAMGPAFLLVDSASNARSSDPPVGRFLRVQNILDAAVGAGTFGAHGPFWRGKSRDQFVQLRVFGQLLLVVGNGRDSNLVKALRAQTPFGSDVGTAGATFRRMPAGRPVVAPSDIDFIEQWINDGCPQDAANTFSSRLSLTTGAFRPDPQTHVAFWRDFDDWSMYHATPEIQDAVGVVFQFFPSWQVFAREPSKERVWTDSLMSAAVRQSVAMLSSRQKQTLESHYGSPLPLLTVLDGFERFGSDGLPDDSLRPEDPRHNMNGAIMWFIWSAFAEACIKLDISSDFWTFYMRAILCGMLNDGVFRQRFTVRGFSATNENHLSIFTHCQSIADRELPNELRSRYRDSGL